MQNRLFWSTAHVQDCFKYAIYVKQSPRLISTRTVSNTIPARERRVQYRGQKTNHSIVTASNGNTCRCPLLGSLANIRSIGISDPAVDLFLFCFYVNFFKIKIYYSSPGLLGTNSPYISTSKSLRILYCKDNNCVHISFMGSTSNINNDI